MVFGPWGLTLGGFTPGCTPQPSQVIHIPIFVTSGSWACSCSRLSHIALLWERRNLLFLIACCLRIAAKKKIGDGCHGPWLHDLTTSRLGQQDINLHLSRGLTECEVACRLSDCRLSLCYEGCDGRVLWVSHPRMNGTTDLEVLTAGTRECPTVSKILLRWKQLWYILFWSREGIWLRATRLGAAWEVASASEPFTPVDSSCPSEASYPSTVNSVNCSTNDS